MHSLILETCKFSTCKRQNLQALMASATRTRSRAKQPKQPKQLSEHLTELPDLPNELWRIIVKMATQDSIEGASRVRLVRKYFSVVLRRSQIWCAFHAVMDRRSDVRNKGNREDEANFFDGKIDKRDMMKNQMIRLSQDQADMFLTRFYIEMCAQSNTIAIARHGVVSIRKLCENTIYR